MIRFGLHAPDALTRERRGFLHRRKTVAVTLYPEVAGSGRADTDELLEQVLCRFPTATGTFKRTHASRFREFDRSVVELVRRQFSPTRPYDVHDAAVSDGRTAVDFYRTLTSLEEYDFRFVASDYAPVVISVFEAGNDRLVLVLDDESGALLQVIHPPFVFNARKRENALLYPINRLVYAWLRRGAVRRLLRKYENGEPGIEAAEIRLLHPDLVALDRDCPDFRFERHDLLAPLSRPFDIVRAMNVLNPAYFPAETLRKVLGHVNVGLREGGIFIVGSNQAGDSPVAGTVFRKAGTRFEALWDSGAGAEIRDLVLCVSP